MNYHPDDFFSLVQEAEEQGAAHLTEVCTPTHLRMNLPINFDDPHGPRANKRVDTTGCKRTAKFLVPLLSDEIVERIIPEDSLVAEKTEDPDTFMRRKVRWDDFDFDDTQNPNTVNESGMPAMAKVCAVDDAMGMWPRFQAAMHTGKSFMVS